MDTAHSVRIVSATSVLFVSDGVSGARSFVGPRPQFFSNMKLYTYDEALSRKGVYKTAHKGIYKDGLEFGGFEFHSDGTNLIPFSHYGKEDDDRFIWDTEMFADTQDIK